MHKTKVIWILTFRTCFSHVRKNISLQFVLFFEWIRSKIFSQNSNKIICCFFVSYSRIELSQSKTDFLKQHFTRACIYISVIVSKTFLSLLSLKMLLLFHSNVKLWSKMCKITVQQKFLIPGFLCGLFCKYVKVIFGKTIGDVRSGGCSLTDFKQASTTRHYRWVFIRISLVGWPVGSEQ